MIEVCIPQTIALELSSACHFSCEYCDRVNWQAPQHTRLRAHMDYDLFTRVVDEITSCGHPISLTLNYEGESLLHPRIVDMLEYCRRRNVRPWLSTRLHPASPELMHVILASCDTVAVSLDMAGPDGCAAPNQSGTDRARAQVANLDLMLQRAHAGSARIVVTTVLERGDSVENPKVLAFVEKWLDRVSSIYLYQGVEFGPNSIRYMNDLGISDHLKRRRPCRQPFSYLAIMSDGRMAPCCITSRVCMQETTVEPTLLGALSGSELAAFRARHKTMDLTHTICDDCDMWIESWLGEEDVTLSLPGGRTVRAVNEGGAIRIERPLGVEP